VALLRHRGRIKENGAPRCAVREARCACLLCSRPLRCRREPRFVAVGRIALDDAALGGFVDLGESGGEDARVRGAGFNARTGLLERRTEARFSGAVARICFFGLSLLFFGRAGVRHECCSYVSYLRLKAAYSTSNRRRATSVSAAPALPRLRWDVRARH